LHGATELEEYNFLVNGRLHRIRLLKHEKGSPFLIEVNGKTSQLKLQEELRYGSPLLLKIAGKSHTVELNKPNRKAQFSIKIDGKTYTVQHETIETVLAPTFKPSLPALEKKTVRKAVSERGAVTAPMPGKVVLLSVKVGDSVQAGDPLCVLEAMKMENEIVSPVRGIVKEVRVSEGAAVNIGEIMVIVSQT